VLFAQAINLPDKVPRMNLFSSVLITMQIVKFKLEHGTPFLACLPTSWFAVLSISLAKTAKRSGVMISINSLPNSLKKCARAFLQMAAPA